MSLARWFLTCLFFGLLLPGLRSEPAPEPECPKGMALTYTGNPYLPLQCVEQGPARPGLSKAAGPSGFAIKPRCPRGSRPVMNIQGLQPLRCVSEPQSAADPDLAPLLDDEGRIRTGTGRPDPGAGTKRKSGSLKLSGRRRSPVRQRPPPLTDKSFGRYSIPGEITFAFPRGWHLTDAWKDAPPTVYVVYDTGRGGKQVTLTVTLAGKGQAGYQEMNLAILKEREWQGAVEDGRGSVGGLPARFVGVPGSSRSAYIAQGEDRYFTLTYSAPAELYAAYLPAFKRLLDTFRAGPR